MIYEVVGVLTRCGLVIVFKWNVEVPLKCSEWVSISRRVIVGSRNAREYVE